AVLPEGLHGEYRVAGLAQGEVTGGVGLLPDLELGDAHLPAYLEVVDLERARAVLALVEGVAQTLVASRVAAARYGACHNTEEPCEAVRVEVVFPVLAAEGDALQEGYQPLGRVGDVLAECMVVGIGLGSVQRRRILAIDGVPVRRVLREVARLVRPVGGGGATGLLGILRRGYRTDLTAGTLYEDPGY
ncbi:hypothetical protein, partial [Prevotella sp. KH2C16]|uniref:hypothetical protein n=1 Tax=Prevotella sp. KH2C16 TaxID=1855325 RepID=UPI0015A65D35